MAGPWILRSKLTGPGVFLAWVLLLTSIEDCGKSMIALDLHSPMYSPMYSPHGPRVCVDRKGEFENYSAFIDRFSHKERVRKSMQVRTASVDWYQTSIHSANSGSMLIRECYLGVRPLQYLLRKSDTRSKVESQRILSPNPSGFRVLIVPRSAPIYGSSYTGTDLFSPLAPLAPLRTDFSPDITHQSSGRLRTENLWIASTMRVYSSSLARQT